MRSIRGAIIPGLGMASFELPDIPDVIRLENPEVNGASSLGESYSLEDMAEVHLRSISQRVDAQQPLILAGMSMGGMILSVLASKFRAQLPLKTRFIFFVTSANMAKNPAIPESLLKSWMSVKIGNLDGFRLVFEPLFSPHFVDHRSQVVENYVRFRAHGENGLSPQGFKRHVKAVLQFEGEKHFSSVDPKECTFIHAQDDSIFTETHWADLKKLCPGTHKVVERCGHMINLERPDLIRSEVGA